MTVMSLSDPGLLAAQRCKRLWAKLGNLCASEPTMRNGNVALGTLEHSQWRDAERAVGYEWSVAFKKMVTTLPTNRSRCDGDDQLLPGKRERYVERTNYRSPGKSTAFSARLRK